MVLQEEFPMIEVSIPSMEREVDESGKTKKLFRVEVLFNGRKHFVLRRASEFQSLHRKLRKIIHTPDFPSKRNPHLRTKPLEQRRHELEDYIQDIIYQNEDVPQVLLDFLHLKHFHTGIKNSSMEWEPPFTSVSSSWSHDTFRRLESDLWRPRDTPLMPGLTAPRTNPTTSFTLLTHGFLSPNSNATSIHASSRSLDELDSQDYSYPLENQQVLGFFQDPYICDNTSDLPDVVVDGVLQGFYPRDVRVSFTAPILTEPDPTTI